MKQTEKVKLQRIVRYKRKLDAGMCANCGIRPRIENRTRCFFCDATRRRIYLRNRGPHVRNRSEIVANPDTHRLASERYRMKNKRVCIERSIRCHRNDKVEVIKKYGGRCACCGESTIEFLTIDHINNNGKQHRHEVTKGHASRFYKWLMKSEIDTTLRVLCMNCNWARRHGRQCPHEIARAASEQTTRTETV